MRSTDEFFVGCVVMRMSSDDDTENASGKPRLNEETNAEILGDVGNVTFVSRTSPPPPTRRHTLMVGQVLAVSISLLAIQHLIKASLSSESK